MGERFQNIKPVIRKKNNNIAIGSSSQTTIAQGTFAIQGAFKVRSPITSPEFGAGERLKVFGLGTHGLGWFTVPPQTIQILDQVSGLDYIHVQTTRGFPEKSEWVLNPGGSNMESGRVIFKLDSKLYISGSGINSGLYYDHKKGERLISITYTL